MSNKTSSLVFNQGIPLKILCLRQQRTFKKTTEQNEKPTLAYLSSIIQDEREYTYSSRLNQITPNLNVDDDRQRRFCRTQRIYNVVSKEEDFNQERQREKQNNVIANKLLKSKTEAKKRGKSHDPYALTQLLGEQWILFRNKPAARKLDRTSLVSYSTRVEKIEEKSKKNRNIRMFRKDFQLFVGDKKKEMQANASKLHGHGKLKSVVNVRQLQSRSLNVAENPQSLDFLQNPHEIARKPKSSQHHRQRSMNASIITKMNFKPLDNFEWSKLGENASDFMIQGLKR